MKVLLEATHELILREYAIYINDWKNLLSQGREIKLRIGTGWLDRIRYVGGKLENEEIKKIRRKIKFVNGFLFMQPKTLL